jgi:tyrosine-protein phosphatase 2/3
MARTGAAKGRTPRPSQGTSSPNYFEFVADPGGDPTDSNAGGHARKNWSPAVTGLQQSAGGPSHPYQNDANPRFEAFRRQSQNSSFRLGHGNLSHFSQGSGTGQPSPGDSHREKKSEGTTVHSPREVSSTHIASPSRTSVGEGPVSAANPQDEHVTNDATPSFFGLPRNNSPHSPSLDLSDMQKDRARHLEMGHRPNSLPHDTTLLLPTAHQHPVHRADTLPSSLVHDDFKMVSPQELVDLMESHIEMLLLDLRVFPQYSHSRISGAINLCIPTTLLKRPNFNVQRLSETFTKEAERAKFGRWKEAKLIVVYDTSSVQLRDATSSVNTLKKFTNEGWRGSALVIRGGYSAFANVFPDRVDQRLASEVDPSGTGKLAIDPRVPAGAPVAGGCPMPSAQAAAIPFFGNIRQNMDLIGGVGQMAVKLPSRLMSNGITKLPPWLRLVTDENDNGKTVADRFFKIEQAEQQRMQKALSGNVSYGTPNPTSAGAVKIAGFEKGTKNRYKDMLPYDHSRVRLQNVPSGGCDYVNASHIKSEWSNRHYVATQAPVPATFHVSCGLSKGPAPSNCTNEPQDFWRVAWEQDARVIVMLTAESEGGQRKCHPYWLSGDYGQFKVKSLSERRVSLEAPKRASTTAFSPLSTQPPRAKRSTIDRRRSTNNSIPSPKDFSSPGFSTENEVPVVIVRKLALLNNAHSFQPMREITQLQYSSWPDFGTPAHPAHVLGLVEQCGAAIRSYDGSKGGGADQPAAKGGRPIVVHCSAGCGRTGTFCTVDSVVDILKRQRQQYPAEKDRSNENDRGEDDGPSRMDVDKEIEGGKRDWLSRGEVDLVAHTVEDFRLQRLSMVQTLRQFVLCYEAILEWVVSAIGADFEG